MFWLCTEINIKGKMRQHKFSYCYLQLTEGPFSPKSTQIQGQAVGISTVLESTGTERSLGDYLCDLSEDRTMVTRVRQN